MNKSNKSIPELVADLPEIYQSVYGHPELSETVSRSCTDRLEQILPIFRKLAEWLGRSLRVLDLGCAQGYFSLHIAELGATVHGVDYLIPNIALCQALAREHEDFKVTFEHAKIEDILPTIQQDQYDLVLGLAVFHHLCHQFGYEAVQAMLGALGEKTAVCVFELAIAEEPLYWAKALPAQPTDLLRGFAFLHELSRHETHLSEHKRPLYYCSNRYNHQLNNNNPSLRQSVDKYSAPVIGIAGLPGSGKSTIISKLIPKGYAPFDDMNGDWAGNIRKIKEHIGRNHKVVFTDILFCDQSWKERAKSEITNQITWIYIENNPWLSCKNSLFRFFRGDPRPIGTIISFTMELSEIYKPDCIDEMVVDAEQFYGKRHEAIVTTRDIVSAYRLFLDREPESMSAVQSMIRIPLRKIKKTMLFSEEFRNKNPELIRELCRHFNTLPSIHDMIHCATEQEKSVTTLLDELLAQQQEMRGLLLAQG